jgi:cyclic lactone autoinducer peptide
MKKNMIVNAIGGCLVIISTMIASTATFIWFHQPETPDVLK